MKEPSWEIPTVRCRDCRGEGVRYGIACGSHGCLPGSFACLTCHGSGKVEGWVPKAKVLGEKLRQRRVKGAPYRTLREEAQRLGLKPTELSALENGRDARILFSYPVEGGWVGRPVHGQT